MLYTYGGEFCLSLHFKNLIGYEALRRNYREGGRISQRGNSYFIHNLWGIFLFHLQFLKRNKAFPGLTGWAQVSGFRGKNVSSQNMKKRMDYDLWYMDNWSMWLDLYIIFKTFYIIFIKPKK